MGKEIKMLSFQVEKEERETLGTLAEVRGATIRATVMELVERGACDAYVQNDHSIKRLSALPKDPDVAKLIDKLKRENETLWPLAEAWMAKASGYETSEEE